MPVHTPTCPIDLDAPEGFLIAEKRGPLKSRARKRKESYYRPVETLQHRWYLSCKPVLDFGLAVILLAISAPLIAVSALLVKLTSKGPAIYSQTRVGRNGRLFTIYKIRTMIDNCESLTGPRWAMPDDPRVTWLGHFLRKTHLDELPQLINVLRGEMSLIGPRPERPEFVTKLERALPAYRERLGVRPGVTGLAQVHLPGDTSLSSVRLKLAYDLYYIQQLSPWLELRILWCTALRVFGVPFRVLRRFSGIPGDEVVERTMEPILGQATFSRFRKSA